MAENGRPLKFKSAEEMEEKIEAYFKSLFKPMKVWNKQEKAYELVINPETNEPYMEQSEPATITGLALALGFATRKSLLDYSAKSKSFLNTISRAKLEVEKYAEKRLFDRDGARGAEFSLRCNFGWREQAEDNSAELEKVQNVLVTIRKAAEGEDGSA